MASSNVAEAAALAREAREIGWLKAHVRVGRSYPLVAVRVSRSAVRGGGLVSSLDTEDESVLGIAAGAIDLARRLDAKAVELTVLEVDAVVASADGGGLVRVSISGDVPSGVGEAEIAELTRAAVGKHVGDEFEVRVTVLGEAVAAQSEATRAEPSREQPIHEEREEPAQEEPIAAAPSLPEEPTLPEEPSPEEPPYLAAVHVDTVNAASTTDELPRAHELSRPEDLPPAEEPPEAEEASAPRAGRGRGAQLLWVALAIVVLALVMYVGVRSPAQQETIVVNQSAPTAVSAAAPSTAVSTLAPTVAPTLAPVVATAPPAPTSTTLPTATGTTAPRATAVAAAAPPPLLDFAAGQAAPPSWPSNPQGVAWFVPDGYHLATRTAGQFVALGLPTTSPPSSNLAVSGTFHKVSGPAGGGYGLILGDSGTPPLDGANQAGQYFVFEVGDKGEVGAWRREDDHWVDILGWTPTPAVKSGTGENQLSVRIVGGQASFSVNGVDVPLGSSPQVNPGGLGVFLGGDGNQAVLTRLTVTAPQQ